MKIHIIFTYIYKNISIKFILILAYLMTVAQLLICLEFIYKKI